MSEQWQPPRYEPRQHQQRMGTQPPPQYPPQPGYGQPPQQPYQPRRKKRRVFLWVFLAVQAIFIIWLIAGITSASGSNGTSAAAEAAKFCANGGWSPLYTSQAQCLSQYGNTLKDAGNAGTAIGAGLVVVFWVVVDFLLGIGYGIYRLASR